MAATYTHKALITRLFVCVVHRSCSPTGTQRSKLDVEIFYVKMKFLSEDLRDGVGGGGGNTPHQSTETPTSQYYL